MPPTVSPVEAIKRQVSATTHRLASLPIVVLMPHSGCNCRCVMCDIWKANSERREVTREQLEHHVGALRSLAVQRVVLSGGEALMHRNLWALCELIKELPAAITLLSTGLLLEAHAANITRWCDEVIVSLDGSQPVHDEIRRVPRAYARLARGVAALRQQAPAFPVSGRSVVQRRNFRDIAGTVDAARELGLDRISFLAADVSSSAFNRPTPWDTERVEDVGLDASEAAELSDTIERLVETHAADFASGFISESPDKMRRIGRYFAALNGEGTYPTTRCNAPWVSTVIEADGTVRPCFFHRSLGNIHEQGLDEILNGPDAVGFRRELDVTADPICRKCVCTLYLGRRAKA